MFWIVLCLLVMAAALSDKTEYCEDVDDCITVGLDFHCVDGSCVCPDGYTVRPHHQYGQRCARCPGLGEPCFRQSECCSSYNNVTLQCWQGVCQPCYDPQGRWICRDNVSNILLVSTTQVVMGTALILGILATFVLLYKLCAATNLRPVGNSYGSSTRLSIGSLQLYVEERLRDAPPRYSRGSPASVAQPAGYQNRGFIHDSSLPPPPYTPPDIKEEDQPTTNQTLAPSIHI